MEEYFQLRDKHTHMAQLTELEKAEDQALVSKEYGINCRSIFMDLEHFDICKCLVPDVMHDILEGALQYELKLCLQYLIDTAKYFTVSSPPGPKYL